MSNDVVVVGSHPAEVVASWDLKINSGCLPTLEGNDPLKMVPFWAASYPAYRLHMYGF